MAMLFQELIERGVSRIHFRALDGLDDDGEGIGGFVRPLRSGLQPIIMFSGHENEFTAAMPGDLDRFALRLMLELAELALKFQSRGLSHDNLPNCDI